MCCIVAEVTQSFTTIQGLRVKDPTSPHALPARFHCFCCSGFCSHLTLHRSRADLPHHQLTVLSFQSLSKPVISSRRANATKLQNYQMHLMATGWPILCVPESHLLTPQHCPVPRDLDTCRRIFLCNRPSLPHWTPSSTPYYTSHNCYPPLLSFMSAALEEVTGK